MLAALAAIPPSAWISWASFIFSLGIAAIPLVQALAHVLSKKESAWEKVREAVPLVWQAVQQELRKNGNVLPNGKTPLEFALELLEDVLHLTPQQRSWAELALKAYHESQGAPEPGAVIGAAAAEVAK